MSENRRLADVLSGLPDTRVLVVGDLILDRYADGDAGRVSPEAPVLVFDFERDRYLLGGACNVAANLSELGASASVLGVIGDDEPGEKLRSLLTDADIDTQALVTNGWNETLYRDTRKQLALGLLTRQGTGKQALDTVEISPMGDISAGGPYAPWSALFLAMDAADLANNAPNRGDTPKLFTSFRFTDALGNFK